MVDKLPKIKPLCDRQPGEKESAQANDKASHELLRRLCREAENLECADCTAKNPGWATLPHGAFICIDCAQIHRHIGRHISQVKAINTGTYLWYPDEVRAMQIMGNRNVAALYLGRASPERRLKKPASGDPRAVREEYIRDKYERKLWLDPNFVPSSSSPSSSSPSSSSPSPSAASPAPSAIPFPAASPTLQFDATPAPDLMSSLFGPPTTATPTPTATPTAFPAMSAFSPTSTMGAPASSYGLASTMMKPAYAAAPAASPLAHVTAPPAPAPPAPSSSDFFDLYGVGSQLPSSSAAAFEQQKASILSMFHQPQPAAHFQPQQQQQQQQQQQSWYW